jgi:8-oxo-dGTP pyrophosphatase MutT (NUDIX family)
MAYASAFNRIETPQNLRFHTQQGFGKAIEKAGMLPFWINEKGERCYLLIRPIPRIDQGKTLPWQPCRGTIDEETVDGMVVEGMCESPFAAAKRECQEEIGLTVPEDATLYSFSHPVQHLGKKNHEYGIAFFAWKLDGPVDPTALQPRDSAAVRVVTSKELPEFAGSSDFNSTYRDTMLGLDQAIARKMIEEDQGKGSPGGWGR